jgi:hypothetical protein
MNNPSFGQRASLDIGAGGLDGRSRMLNPLKVAFAVVDRFMQWTAPKSRPLPDPEGRQGLQPASTER